MWYPPQYPNCNPMPPYYIQVPVPPGTNPQDMEKLADKVVKKAFKTAAKKADKEKKDKEAAKVKPMMFTVPQVIGLFTFFGGPVGIGYLLLLDLLLKTIRAG